MSGLWELITRSHHPIVTVGLILILGIFLVNAALHSASFTLRLVAVAIDELATAGDHVRANAHQAMKAIRRLRGRAHRQVGTVADS